MNTTEIVQQRLHNQQLIAPMGQAPAAVVRWLGAVQAQDYAAAKWALGLRLHGVQDDAVDQAFATGAILRTHLLRPTWHFVTPQDIRWLLALTAPRVHALNAHYYRKLELDQAIFSRSHAALIQALQGGQQRTREELGTVLDQAGIPTSGELRISYLLMQAELAGIVCSGARRGKQFTYALLDERVPSAQALPREEALSALVQRFFLSHGPATLRDFVKWSSLTTDDARQGLAASKAQLEQEVVDGQTYWFAPTQSAPHFPSPIAHLLPNYDEYFIGYRDYNTFFNSAHPPQLVYSHVIMVDGRIIGTWKRTISKRQILLTANFFVPLTAAEQQAVALAAQHYGAFLDLPVVWASA